MAPFTRSQYRAKVGAFSKDVIENPPIMDVILRQLLDSRTEGNVVSKTARDIANVRLVFKSEAIVDVINKHIVNLKAYIQREKAFETELFRLLALHDDVYDMDERITSAGNIYSYCLVDNIDILNSPKFFHLRKGMINNLNEINKESLQFKTKYGDKCLKIIMKK
uniref:Uncharacterized protein n=1 Tax=Pyramimonas orientalis virus TaxID=455367 RepID=A0A7M3UNS8_POV01|nr:hypothetical protein HWQ62_00224 [Pyramimonas orientalis virus]